MVCKCFKELLTEECIFILITGFMETWLKKSAFFCTGWATNLDFSPESSKIAPSAQKEKSRKRKIRLWRKKKGWHSFELLYCLHLLQVKFSLTWFSQVQTYSNYYIRKDKVFFCFGLLFFFFLRSFVIRFNVYIRFICVCILALGLMAISF